MKRIAKTLFLASTLLAFTACGDGDDDDPADDMDTSPADASVDMEPDEPDAPPEFNTTVAIQDMTGYELGLDPLTGAAVNVPHGLSISIDVQEKSGPPGIPPTCTTTVYMTGGDDPMSPAASVDVGPVAITIDDPEQAYSCSMSSVDNAYVCPVKDGDLSATDTLLLDNNNNGTITVTGPADSFEAAHAGHYLSLTGTTINTVTGRTRVNLPIVMYASPTTIVVGGAPGDDITLDAGRWSVLAGQGPNPAFVDANEPIKDTSVGGASAAATALDYVLDVMGVDAANAFTPRIRRDDTVDAELELNNIWAGQTAGAEQDLIFDCKDPDTGLEETCDPDTMIFAITVTSTTAALSPTDPTGTPIDEEEGGLWIATTCQANGLLNAGTPSLTIPAVEVAKHVGAAKPITRTRTTVSRFNSPPFNDVLAGERFFFGHGWVGFTTAPPP